MANQSFVFWEATITLNGATAAVVQNGRIDVEDNLERVPAIGDHRPQDLKEGLQVVRWKFRRAYFADATAADFIALFQRDPNGYKPSFDMTIRLRDNSTGTPADKTYTLSDCKSAAYGLEIPTESGVILEDLSGEALDWSRA